MAKLFLHRNTISSGTALNWPIKFVQTHTAQYRFLCNVNPQIPAKVKMRDTVNFLKITFI